MVIGVRELRTRAQRLQNRDRPVQLCFCGTVSHARVIRVGKGDPHARRFDLAAGSVEQRDRLFQAPLRRTRRTRPVGVKEAGAQALERGGTAQRFRYVRQGLFVEIGCVGHRPRFLGLARGLQAHRHGLVSAARGDEVARDVNRAGPWLI